MNVVTDSQLVGLPAGDTNAPIEAEARTHFVHASVWLPARFVTARQEMSHTVTS